MLESIVLLTLGFLSGYFYHFFRAMPATPPRKTSKPMTQQQRLMH